MIRTTNDVTEFIEMERGPILIPVGRIEDIEVYFVHDKNADEAINRWNLFRKRINWDCLIYIFSEDTATITYSLAKAFCALNERHMLIFQKNMYCS